MLCLRSERQIRQAKGEAGATPVCPNLALVGEGAGSVAMALFESFSRSVRGPVTRRIFTTAEGADSHCQLGNLPLSNAVVYDWLDEVFT